MNNNNNNMAPSFPVGVRFHPTDEEKMNYLLYKVTELPLPCDGFIGTDDLYGEKEPWEIFGDSEEDELYFFTQLKKIGKKTGKDDYKRFSRNVGRGTWSNKGMKVPIYGKGNRGVVGHKRCFRYESKRDEGTAAVDRSGKWLLKEYTLPPGKAEGKVKPEYKDYVPCVLKKKGISGKGISEQLGGTPDVEIRLDHMLAEEAVLDDVSSVRGCCHEAEALWSSTVSSSWQIESSNIEIYNCNSENLQGLTNFGVHGDYEDDELFRNLNYWLLCQDARNYEYY